MKKTLSSLTVAALALFGAQSVMAQAASAPTRAEVKKEAADANKAASKSLVPADAAGQQSPKEKAATSDTTRDARKTATAEANKAGAIPGTGVSNVPEQAAGQKAPKAAAATSDTTRDARKASTAAANKAGEIPGTGVSNVPAEAGAAPKK
jgi:hypothetical protein